MQPEEVIAELGGVATRAELLTQVTEHALRTAVAEGGVLRQSRGRYTLPHVPRIGERAELVDIAQAGRRAGHRLSGTVILQSAAARWGWKMKWLPTRPQVAVPRGRKVAAAARRQVEVRYWHIPPSDLDDGWVTDRVRTALDCASHLAPDEALAVVDSALREGMVTRDELLLAAASLPDRYRRRAEMIIRLASPKAANPFESVLRRLAPGRDPRRRRSHRHRRPGRRAAAPRARGGLLRVARVERRSAQGLSALRPLRRRRVARPPVHVGHDHAPAGTGQGAGHPDHRATRLAGTTTTRATSGRVTPAITGFRQTPGRRLVVVPARR